MTAFSSIAVQIVRRVGGARKSLRNGALREPVRNNETRFQGLDSVRNPPFPYRFASRTLQFVNNPGARTGRTTAALGHTQSVYRNTGGVSGAISWLSE
jgi:hypothetical protein